MKNKKFIFVLKFLLIAFFAGLLFIQSTPRIDAQTTLAQTEQPRTEPYPIEPDNPSTGSAGTPSALNDSLNAKYSLSASLREGGSGPYAKAVTNAWKIILGLANAFVILILIFLAFVNIAHIQYDTYMIKKSLPNLILGIILANFSLFICRMFTDAANVLTFTFIGDNIKDNLMWPLVDNLGIIPAAGGVTSAAIVSAVLGGVAISIGLGLLALILLALPVIGIAIILFLLYIRIAVILALAVIAPLVFVMMAFPPTAGFFKTWWSWFLKWVFMKPVMFFILWLAVEIGGREIAGPDIKGFSLPIWFITLALTYTAVTIPFKLGGAVMGMWGRIGSTITGTGKGGYARNYLGGVQKSATLEGKNAYYKTRLGQKHMNWKMSAMARDWEKEKGLKEAENLEIWRRTNAIREKEQRGRPVTDLDKRFWKPWFSDVIDERETLRNTEVDSLINMVKDPKNLDNLITYMSGNRINGDKEDILKDQAAMKSIRGTFAAIYELESRQRDFRDGTRARNALGNLNFAVNSDDRVEAGTAKFGSGNMASSAPHAATGEESTDGYQQPANVQTHVEAASNYLRQNFGLKDVHVNAILDDIKMNGANHEDVAQKIQQHLLVDLVPEGTEDAEAKRKEIIRSLENGEKIDSVNQKFKVNLTPELVGNLQRTSSPTFKQDFAPIAQNLQQSFQKSFQSEVEIPLKLAWKLIPHETTVDGVEGLMKDEESKIRQALSELDSPAIKVEQARKIVANINPEFAAGIANVADAKRRANTALSGVRSILSSALLTQIKKQSTLTDLLPPDVLKHAKQEYNRVTQSRQQSAPEQSEGEK